MSAEERLLQDYFDVIAAVKEDRARDLLQRFQRALAQESDNHKKANAHLLQSEEELAQQKANVAALEKQVKQLTAKLLKERDQKQSFQESCEKYVVSFFHHCVLYMSVVVVIIVPILYLAS